MSTNGGTWTRKQKKRYVPVVPAIKKKPLTDRIWNVSITPLSPQVDKDDFLDVVYWARQIIGLVAGVVWGLTPLRGGFGFLLFIFVNFAIVYYHYKFNLGINEDDFDGFFELNKEGFLLSIAGFMMMWIVVHSYFHLEVIELISKSIFED